MGTVSVSTSLGEKFNITFTNGNSYDLDSIFDAKSRLSQKALVVEVKRNQVVAQKALKQLEADLTRNISSSLNTEEVRASISDIINSVFKVYGRESGSAPFAIQLIDSKITNYIQSVLNRTDIYFDITIYDNKANIEYKLPDDFIRGKFTEYYNKFTNNYSSTRSVSTGGLAISDKEERISVSNADYGRYLFNEPSNNYYGASYDNCGATDIHWHQCGCDHTKPEDIGGLDFMTNPENIALINELKKTFLSKKSASEKLETKYVRAEKGYFKKVYVDDDLVMKNLAVTGNVSGATVSGDNVIVGDTLRVDSGRIELSAPDGHFYEVFLDKDNGSLVLHSRVAGHDSFGRVATIEEGSESGHVYYDSESKSFKVKDVDLDNYYSKSEIDEKLENIEHPSVDLSHLATKDELQEAIASIEHPTVDLTGYATEDWVQEQGYLTAIPEEYITNGELTDRVYTKAEVENMLAALSTSIENTYITQEAVENTYITQEEVQNNYVTNETISKEYITQTEIESKYITQEEVRDNYITEMAVETIVQTKVEEVITGGTSQVNAIKYTDFDELED